MLRLRRKRISIVAKLRNYFITGIVVLVPIGITLYLTKFFISFNKFLRFDLYKKFSNKNENYKSNSEKSNYQNQMNLKLKQ